jgi:fringe protein
MTYLYLNIDLKNLTLIIILQQTNYFSNTVTSPPITTTRDHNSETTQNKKVKFWFATGGAGFCISRALALKMMPIAGDGKFMEIGDRIRFPDDVTMGFIVEYLLNTPLTVVDAFHSHLEPMEYIKKDTFPNQVYHIWPQKFQQNQIYTFSIFSQ